jgi:hypothetical protein
MLGDPGLKKLRLSPWRLNLHTKWGREGNGMWGQGPAHCKQIYILKKIFCSNQPSTRQCFFVCRFQHRNCGLSGYLFLPWHAGQPHLCGDVTNSTWQDILVPSGQPSFTHILTTRSTSPAWWRHQLNPAGSSGSLRSTLPHSLTHYQVKLTCVVTSPTQPIQNIPERSCHPPSFTYSPPGPPHQWVHVSNSIRLVNLPSFISATPG